MNLSAMASRQHGLTASTHLFQGYSNVLLLAASSGGAQAQLVCQRTASFNLVEQFYTRVLLFEFTDTSQIPFQFRTKSKYGLAAVC